MTVRRPALLALLFVLLPSLAACLGGKSPPSQFYLLEPLPGTAAGGGDRPGLSIALSPVRIPQYADRPQMVSATGPNAYKLSETNRWAEPLADNIGRVLAQNLRGLSPWANVLASGLSAGAGQPAWKLAVAIVEFQAGADGQARLVAQWNIQRGAALAASRQASYQEPAAVGDYAAMAGALNRCLDRLSRDLTADLARLREEGGGG